MSGGRTRKQSNESEGISYGYIVIPTNVDRDLYVESCLRRGRVSVMKEGGVFNMDLYITREALQNVHFPENPGEKGTAVVIANNPYAGTQMIIGTYDMNDEFPNWSEDTFRFRKIINKTSATLLIDPKNKVINLTVDSPEDVQLNIKATGSENSKVNVFSTGSVNVKADQNVSVIGYKQIENQIINVEKPEEELRFIVMDLEKLQVVRKTDKINESVTIDDTGIVFVTKEGQTTISLTDEELNVKTGASTLQMNKDIINFNGGGLDGLVEINQLTTKLNNLVQQLNNFVSVFNSHNHTVQVAVPAGTGSTLALSTSPATSATSFSKDDYENKKIVQG